MELKRWRRVEGEYEGVVYGKSGEGRVVGDGEDIRVHHSVALVGVER